MALIKWNYELHYFDLSWLIKFGENNIPLMSLIEGLGRQTTNITHKETNKETCNF